MVQFANGAVKPADRNKTKPIYLLIAEDTSGTKTKIQFYRAKSLIETANLVEITGHRLTKAQKDKFVAGPHEDIDNIDPSWEEVNTKIPISRVIRIDNVRYNNNKNR